MLPEIKHATLKVEDLFTGRGTSSNPPLWQHVKGKPKDDIPDGLKFVKSTKKQVALLDLIASEPGEMSAYYANKLGMGVESVRKILKRYRSDGIVRQSESNQWYLADLN